MLLLFMLLRLRPFTKLTNVGVDAIIVLMNMIKIAIKGIITIIIPIKIAIDLNPDAKKYLLLLYTSTANLLSFSGYTTKKVYDAVKGEHQKTLQ